MIQKKKLSDICNIVKGNVTITKAIAGEYPLVTTAEERSTSNEFQFDCRAVCIPLVSSTGHGDASLKRIHYQEGKFALGCILCALIPKDENVIDARYLYIFLSYFKEDLIVPLMQGSANVSLTIKSLSTVEVVLPPIERQLEIVKMVNIIDQAKATIELNIMNQKIQLKLLRENILHFAINGKLVPQDETEEPSSVLLQKILVEKQLLIKSGKIRKQKELPSINDDDKPYEIPSNWVWLRLGNICKLEDGIKIDNVQLPYLEAKYLRRKIPSKIMEAGYYVRKGEYLILVDGENSGEVFIANEDGILGSTFKKINFNQNIYIRFILLILKRYQGIFRGGKKGIAIPHLDKNLFKSIPVGLPPFDEQKRIVARVDELFTLCDMIENNIEKSSRYCEMLMKAVLQVLI